MITIAELPGLKEHLEAYHSTSHAHMTECRKYYNKEFKVYKWKNIEGYKPGTAKNKVDKARDHLFSIGRRVIVPYFGEAEAKKKLAGKLERAGKGILDTVERSRAVNPIAEIMKNVFIYGMFCLKGPLYLEQLYPKKQNMMGLNDEDKKSKEESWEEERARAFPFYTRSVPPLNLLIDPTMENPQYVIEFFTRKALSIKTMWPKWNQKGYDDFDDVDWWEYWDKDRYCYWVGKGEDSTCVTGGFVDNKMGYLPYHIGLSGLGEESPDGAPEYRIVSLLYQAISGIQAEADIKTAAKAFMLLNVYGKPRVKLQTPNIKMAKALGEISIIPEEAGYEDPDPPRLNPDLFKIIGMIDQDIDESTVARVLEGEVMPAFESGYDRAIATGQARLKLQAPHDAIENVLSNYLTCYGPLIKNVVGDRITIFGYHPEGTVNETIGPGDFKSNPIFVVKLDGETPEEQDRKFRMGLELWAAKALPWETICKDFWGYDPTQQRKLMQIGAAMDDPRIHEAITNLAIQTHGLNRYIRDVQESVKKPGNLPPDSVQKLQRLGSIGQPTELGSVPEGEL